MSFTAVPVRVILRLRGYRNRLRALWWSWLLKPKGRIFVNGRIVIDPIQKVHIGDQVSLNEGVSMFGKEEIWIGNHVHISPWVVINTGGLDLSLSGAQRGHFYKPVFIEDGVWIGSNALINPGIRLGHDCVIGAGAVVTKDVPPYAVAVGVPAKVLRFLDHANNEN